MVSDIVSSLGICNTCGSLIYGEGFAWGFPSDKNPHLAPLNKGEDCSKQCAKQRVDKYLSDEGIPRQEGWLTEEQSKTLATELYSLIDNQTFLPDKPMLERVREMGAST